MSIYTTQPKAEAGRVDSVLRRRRRAAHASVTTRRGEARRGARPAGPPEPRSIAHRARMSKLAGIVGDDVAWRAWFARARSWTRSVFRARSLPALIQFSLKQNVRTQ